VLIPVAKGSDRIGREIDGWREAPERRSHGFASLAVKGRSRRPAWNESDKTFGNPYNRLGVPRQAHSQGAFPPPYVDESDKTPGNQYKMIRSHRGGLSLPRL
jgi:hypothetical protein